MEIVRVAAVAGVAACVLGCAPEGTTISPDEPFTRQYVLSSIRLEASDGTRASGLDLDGLDSTGVGPTCADRVADLESPRDPGERGVDNVLAAYVPSLRELVRGECAAETEDCLGEVIARRIASGELLVGVEVRGIVSYAQDDAVEVVLHRASSFGGAPELIAGELAPGQSFELAPLAVSTGASIENGILRASFDTPFTLDLVAGADIVLAVPLRTVQLEAAITGTALRDGVLAGGLDVDELARMSMPECIMEPCDPLPLDGIADLSPRPDDPTRCREISFALDVAAVDAAEP